MTVTRWKENPGREWLWEVTIPSLALLGVGMVVLPPVFEVVGLREFSASELLAGALMGAVLIAVFGTLWRRTPFRRGPEGE